MVTEEKKHIALLEGIFICRIEGFLTEAAIHHLFTLVGQRVCRQRSSGLILDCHSSKIIASSAQDWIVNEWLPALRKTFSCPYRVAIITSTDYFARYSIENLMKKVQQKDKGIYCQIVDNETEAKTWISNFKA